MRNLRNRAVRAILGLTVGGVVMQLGGCGLNALARFAGNFNPCGVVLVCDPVSFEFFTSGYRGPGVNPDIDPACTYPPYCANDPFVQTLPPN